MISAGARSPKQIEVCFCCTTQLGCWHVFRRIWHAREQARKNGILEVVTLLGTRARALKATGIDSHADALHDVMDRIPELLDAGTGNMGAARWNVERAKPKEDADG